VLWRDGVADWLPFLALVTLLVFARGHLYSPRETREGAARVASSLLLVAVLTLAYGLAVGHQFTTFGLFPLALVTSTLLIAALRASYENVTGSLLRVVGVRPWLLIAAFVKLTSRGSVLYGDHRIGLGEREFQMLKFRTMVAGAERQQSELEDANEATGPIFKIRDDPRVTVVGRVLRRLS